MKLPHTMLHTKYKVKQGLTIVVALQLAIHFKSTQRECVSRFIKTKMPHG